MDLIAGNGNGEITSGKVTVTAAKNVTATGSVEYTPSPPTVICRSNTWHLMSAKTLSFYVYILFIWQGGNLQILQQ